MPYVVVELEAVHCWLGNWTMENSEKASGEKKQFKSQSILRVDIIMLSSLPSVEFLAETEEARQRTSPSTAAL